jgi:holo-[acyl-carrier protein] synthase
MPASPSPEARHSVGVDVVIVARLQRLLSEDPSAAAELFTLAEMEYAAAQRRPEDHLAARFAAKEAVFKALGIGLLDGVDWTDVEVTSAPDGHPTVRLTGNAELCAERHDVRELEVSLSHSGGIAIAQVLVVSGARSCA